LRWLRAEPKVAAIAEQSLQNGLGAAIDEKALVDAVNQSIDRKAVEGMARGAVAGAVQEAIRLSFGRSERWSTNRRSPRASTARSTATRWVRRFRIV
jgi:hypothetical protein